VFIEKCYSSTRFDQRFARYSTFEEWSKIF